MLQTAPEPRINVEIEVDLAEVIKHNLRAYPHLRSVEDFMDMEIDYSPFYQRKYVWDINKATFFIESLLLNAEIPPLIIYRDGDIHEIIDGRQRYETILKFLKKEFKLHANGLTRLKHLAGKDISSLGAENVGILKKKRLRVYEYEIHNNMLVGEAVQVLLKREIFRRYNTGITSLTQLEIFKAKYINDSLNFYFKTELEDDPSFLQTMKEVMFISGSNMQKVLRKVRTMLVLHQVPIYAYANDRKDVYAVYDDFSASIREAKKVGGVFTSFKEKILYIQDLFIILQQQHKLTANALITQTIFWALSICQQNGFSLENLKAVAFKRKLAANISRNIKKYLKGTYSEAQMLRNAFNTTALFFEHQTSLSFDEYLHSTEKFKVYISRLSHARVENEEQLISKKVPVYEPEFGVSNVSALVNSIAEKEFVIRPRYQRGEVINKQKASSIIESLLLGIELPPIFLYRRMNGVTEVIDGQQRLLALLAFLGGSYWNDGKLVKSKKANFALDLNQGILRELSGLKFDSLDPKMRSKIRDASIRIVEIKEEQQPDFDPVDLFMRLNFKPYPIKENSFESWNSFVDKQITDKIKELYVHHRDLIFLTQKNERMHDEEMITCLVYLHYWLSTEEVTLKNVKDVLAIYVTRGLLQVRFGNKADITRVLMNPRNKDGFLAAIADFEKEFFGKIRYLLSDCDNQEKGIEEILNNKSEGKVRSLFRYSILAVMLEGVPMGQFRKNYPQLKADISKFLGRVSKTKRAELFESHLQNFWNSYSEIKQN